MKTAILIAATLVLSVFLFSTPSWAPLVCKDESVSAYGGWKRVLTWGLPRGSARRAWKAKVYHDYGYCWHFWTRAADKIRDCQRDGRYKRCRYQARPCCRAGVID